MITLGRRVSGLLMAMAIVSTAAGGCRGLRGGSGAQPKNDNDKTFYAIGLMLGRNLAVFGLSDHELDLVKGGLSDAVLKRKPAVELETYRGKVDALARERSNATAQREKESSKTVVESASREPGAVRTPSGMVIRTVKPGNGPSPQPSDRVKVHYEGRLTDGTVFDSSIKRGEPAVFPLTGVIRCWTEGVGRMKVGEKAVLTCPSDLAYGDSGRPPTIPGGATLIFDVELIEIVK
jgi:FKBP-type peptidyl-prolyl cis-trans isomerase FkpA